MHAVVLPASAHPHHNTWHLQRPGRPVANSVQGYGLKLPGIAHTLLANAATNKKCQFSGPLPKTPKLFAPKTISGVPWSSPENVDTILKLVPE